MNVSQPFQILKMDRRRGNIVVSRRAIMEETRAEQRSELVQNLAEGQVVDGVVKNITDYGAFVDLGGIDGLLHVTDIAWKRVNHPSDVLHVGQTLKVQIIRINPETPAHLARMKQLDKIRGRSWPSAIRSAPASRARSPILPTIRRLRGAGRRHRGPRPCLRDELDQEERASGQDPLDLRGDRRSGARDRRRQAPHLAGPQADPEQSLAHLRRQVSQRFTVEGEVKNITEFGLFIGLDGDVDGMVHLSDIDWKRAGEEAIKDFKKGDIVKAKVLDVDQEKERISLGIKQLGTDPVSTASGIKKGDTVTCEVVKVEDNGLEVRVAGTDMSAYVKRADLARDRSEQRPERFAVGEKFDAKVTLFDAKARKMNVSIKALEIAEEKEAVAQYGSSDSGASLGDISGAALKKKDAEAKSDMTLSTRVGMSPARALVELPCRSPL